MIQPPKEADVPQVGSARMFHLCPGHLTCVGHVSIVGLPMPPPWWVSSSSPHDRGCMCKKKTGMIRPPKEADVPPSRRIQQKKVGQGTCFTRGIPSHEDPSLASVSPTIRIFIETLPMVLLLPRIDWTTYMMSLYSISSA